MRAHSVHQTCNGRTNQRVLHVPACTAASISRRSLKETRHTLASLALRAGVHPKVVQEAMGHRSVAITLDNYSHLIGNISFDAMGHLDRLFGAS